MNKKLWDESITYVENNKLEVLKEAVLDEYKHRVYLAQFKIVDDKMLVELKALLKTANSLKINSFNRSRLLFMIKNDLKYMIKNKSYSTDRLKEAKDWIKKMLENDKNSK